MNRNETDRLRKETDQLRAVVQSITKIIERKSYESNTLTLTERQQAVLAMYFGMHDGKPMNLDGIAKALGKNREGIRMTLNHVIGRFIVNGIELRHVKGRQWHGYKYGPQKNTVAISKRGIEHKKCHFAIGDTTACGASCMDRRTTQDVTEITCKNCSVAAANFLRGSTVYSFGWGGQEMPKSE